MVQDLLGPMSVGPTVNPKAFQIQMGPELFWDLLFLHVFPLWDFFGIYFSAGFPFYLQHVGAGNCHFNCLCNIMELEPLHRICYILVEFVTFWSWKLLFQGYLQHF